MPKDGSRVYQRLSPGFASLSRPVVPYICPTNLCLSRIALVEDCCCSARKTLFTHDGPHVYFRRGRRLTRSYVEFLRVTPFDEMTTYQLHDYEDVSKLFELIKFFVTPSEGGSDD